MKRTQQIEEAITLVEKAIEQTTETAIEQAIDSLPEYTLSPENYQAYKTLFKYIYPKVDINIWSPEMKELIVIIANDE